MDIVGKMTTRIFYFIKESVVIWNNYISRRCFPNKGINNCKANYTVISVKVLPSNTLIQIAEGVESQHDLRHIHFCLTYKLQNFPLVAFVGKITFKPQNTYILYIDESTNITI